MDSPSPLIEFWTDWIDDTPLIFADDSVGSRPGTVTVTVPRCTENLEWNAWDVVYSLRTLANMIEAVPDLLTSADAMAEIHESDVDFRPGREIVPFPRTRKPPL